jgi:hypothetical protein
VMSARRRDKDVGITMWETSVVKNVGSGPLVGLNAIQEERPEVNERNECGAVRTRVVTRDCLVGWLAMEPPSGL